MRTILAAAAAALVLGLASQGIGTAALDPTRGPQQPTLELVVFEHPDCTYCQVFRSRVAPAYRTSPHQARAPMRFVDVTGPDADRMGLNESVRMVPTAVMMKNGREVDRIAGYWAQDHFFKMVAHILVRAE
jgi:hypothetical protein